MGEKATRIEAVASVGCGYQFTCVLRLICPRNQTEMVVAQVPIGEETKLAKLVADWKQKPEKPCHSLLNPLHGGEVAIQHFDYEARIA